MRLKETDREKELRQREREIVTDGVRQVRKYRKRRMPPEVQGKK